MRRRLIMVLKFMAAALAPAAMVHAQDIHRTEPGRIPSTQTAPHGRSCLTFDQRSPLSGLDEMIARMRYKPSEPTANYDVAQESFEVYLPDPRVPRADSADAAVHQRAGGTTRGLGLIVWVSASDDGAPPKEWLPVLDRHGLIWVGANKSGNEHKVDRRFGLAVDAAVNMLERHRDAVDTNRVYIAGISGGGRIASMLALLYPDLFRGGYYIVGCNYFRPLPLPDDPSQHWRASFNRPAEKWLDLARKQSRFVLLTGENDANRAQTLSTYKHGYLRDGLTRAEYIEVPKMGHASPSAEWFDRGIEALDRMRPSATNLGGSPAGPTTHTMPIQ